MVEGGSFARTSVKRLAPGDSLLRSPIGQNALNGHGPQSLNVGFTLKVYPKGTRLELRTETKGTMSELRTETGQNTCTSH